MRRRLAYSMLKTGGSEPFLHVLQENGDVLQAVLQNQGISTFSVFTGDRHVCLYYETANDDFVFEWEPAAGRWLENWPDESGGQTVVSMIDIFHDGMPEDA
ncbi:hypothetical protein K0U00_44015, partial [Paenibacillus sepulcri]|nr:hypothetical protein [Paenibacillus sepulcri]